MNLTWEKFETVYQSKHHAALFLGVGHIGFRVWGLGSKACRLGFTCRVYEFVGLGRGFAGLVVFIVLLGLRESIDHVPCLVLMETTQRLQCSFFLG